MVALQYIGRNKVSERELFSLSLADFTSLPDPISLPGKHFIAFLAADATNIDTETLQKFASRLLDAGCVYFCAWGADCERVHDIFDDVSLSIEPVIMTTWHSTDSLDEALWFFVYNAYPDDGYSDACRSNLAITVGHPEWAEQIGKRLADLDTFNRDVLGEP
ncbi:MAG: hypothetical protein JWR19_3619 [Pedosphaera sp.]|nr:hypothetical protein [Pedosphaera sp.]